MLKNWRKIAPNFLIKQLPNIVKSMSFSLYFVRRYYSESWMWSHLQNNTIVCSFSRKIAKIDVLLYNNLCLSLLPRNVDVVLRMLLWRYVTTRFPANIESSSFKTSMHLYLWRYVAVQIWRVIELFVPGIVASTIKFDWNLWNYKGIFPR